MKTVILEDKKLCKAAAMQIASLLTEHPDAVLALTAGRSTDGLYECLSDMCRAGEISFAGTHILAVAEYEGTDRALSLRSRLEEKLISNIDIPAEHVHYPDPSDPEGYDALIYSLGGIDAAVLGIGMNCHIGYNEPATPFDSHTHIQKLTDRTKRQLVSAGFPADCVPENAVTMGIKTLTEAKNIMLIALGSEKADPVHLMLYGKTMSFIPASFLQIPLNVTVYLDPDSAANI